MSIGIHSREQELLTVASLMAVLGDLEVSATEALQGADVALQSLVDIGTGLPLRNVRGPWTTVTVPSTVTVSGTLTSDGVTPVTFGELSWTDTYGMRPRWSQGTSVAHLPMEDEGGLPLTGEDGLRVLSEAGLEGASLWWDEVLRLWMLQSGQSVWTSSDNVQVPDGVTWTPYGDATGLPALEFSGTAVTGEVRAVREQWLDRPLTLWVRTDSRRGTLESTSLTVDLGTLARPSWAGRAILRCTAGLSGLYDTSSGRRNAPLGGDLDLIEQVSEPQSRRLPRQSNKALITNTGPRYRPVGNGSYSEILVNGVSASRAIVSYWLSDANPNFIGTRDIRFYRKSSNDLGFDHTVDTWTVTVPDDVVFGHSGLDRNHSFNNSDVTEVSVTSGLELVHRWSAVYKASAVVELLGWRL